MLYKRKIISKRIIRIRSKQKPLDCEKCDLRPDYCCEAKVCVYRYSSKTFLYLTSRENLCILLKRSLYYIEKETGNKTTIEYSIF